jgi:hypothetical protein
VKRLFPPNERRQKDISIKEPHRSALFCNRVVSATKQSENEDTTDMKTHANKSSEEANEQVRSMSEMADALRKNCEQTLRTSLKFQEEAGRWWSSVFNPATCAQQWQERLGSATSTANSILPLAQKPVSELIDLAEKNSRTSADLMKKALDAAQTPSLPESQAKWTEFWTSSLGAVQSNTEELSQISSRAMDSWVGFIRKSAETEVRTSKTA